MLKEYATALIKSSLIIAAALEIAHSRMKKSSRLAAGLILICIIMLPIIDIIADNGLDFSFDYDFIQDDYDNMSDEAIEASFEKGIEKYIAEKCGIAPSDVKVNADKFSLEDMRAERIYVTLSGKGIFSDYKALEELIEKEFTQGGDCEVRLDV